MNLLKLSFFLLIALSIVACGEDEDTVVKCTQADWIGTYTGIYSCDGSSDSTTVTITASGADAVVIKQITTSGQVTATIEYDPITINECMLSFNATEQGITVDMDASIDGDNFSLTDITTYNGGVDNCTITATRD